MKLLIFSCLLFATIPVGAASYECTGFCEAIQGAIDLITSSIQLNMTKCENTCDTCVPGSGKTWEDCCTAVETYCPYGFETGCYEACMHAPLTLKPAKKKPLNTCKTDSMCKIQYGSHSCCCNYHGYPFYCGDRATCPHCVGDAANEFPFGPQSIQNVHIVQAGKDDGFRSGQSLEQSPQPSEATSPFWTALWIVLGAGLALLFLAGATIMALNGLERISVISKNLLQKKSF